VCLARLPTTSSTRILNPRVLSQLASYDVASNICLARLPTTSSTRILDPRVLSQLASRDVASNICPAVDCLPHH